MLENAHHVLTPATGFLFEKNVIECREPVNGRNSSGFLLVSLSGTLKEGKLEAARVSDGRISNSKGRHM